MSWNPAFEPGCPDEVGIRRTLVIPRSHNLGGSRCGGRRRRRNGRWQSWGRGRCDLLLGDRDEFIPLPG